MKRLIVMLAILLLVNFTVGCGGGRQRVALPKGVSIDIAVLSLGADTTGLNDDQIALLQHTLNWMDRDILRSLARKGFKPVRINNESDFTGTGNGHLLKISITKHKMIPKGARFLAGMMAGTDQLGAHYDLVDSSGKTVISWDDFQGSTKGGTYCAQTLNRNTANKIATYFGAN